MPLLFQWRRRLENRAVTETVLLSYLDHALAAHRAASGVFDAERTRWAPAASWA